MSSIQYGLPLATNKVLNAIDAFRTSSENALDYYIEPIAEADTLKQIYRVHINFINSIHIIGTLYNNDKTRVEGDTIPNTQLIQGKLYTNYYFPFVLTSYNSGEKSFLLGNNMGGDKYRVILKKIDSSAINLIPYTYNYKTNEVKLYEGTLTKPIMIYPCVYITHPSVGTNGTLGYNIVYYFAEVPDTVQDELICWKFP